MTTYPHLIADVCRTEKTTAHVKTLIPVLISWAKSGITTNTYKELIRALGMVGFSGIGRVLAKVEDVLQALRKASGLQIPTLNVLVRGKTGLPSGGFEYVNPSYSSLSPEEKKNCVDLMSKKTISYENWDLILKLLELDK